MVGIRCRTNIFAAALGVFVLVTFLPGRVAMPRSVPPTSVEIRLDSLFRSGNFPALVDSASNHLAVAQAGGDSVMIGRMLTALGRGQIMTGSPEGISNLDLSILVSQTVRDTVNWMSALGYKSLVFSYQGNYDGSVELNELRLELAQLTRDRASEAWARTMLGYIALNRGEFETARSEYTAAVDIFFELDQEREALTPLVGLGRVYNSTRDIDNAKECYQRVFVTSRRVGDRVNEANAANNLGTIEFEFGDMELAAQYYERALTIARTTGNVRGTITPATNIALANAYLGRFEEAAAVFESTIATCKEYKFSGFIPSLMTRMGEVRFLQQRLNASARWYRRALAAHHEIDQKTHDAATFGVARALVYLDSASTALEYLDADPESRHLPEYSLGIHIYRSSCLSSLGRPEEALAEAWKAEEAAQASKLPMNTPSARRLGACYRALGNHDEAMKWFRESLTRHAVTRISKTGYDWRQRYGGIGGVVDDAAVVLEQPDKSRPEMEAELFDVIQRFKMRTLIERITEPRRLGQSGTGFEDLQSVDLRTLQEEILEPGELFLDFAVGERAGYLFAITRASCRLVMVPGRYTEMPGKVAIYRQIVGQHPSRSGGPLEPEDVDRMNRSMGESILGGVADLVRSSTVLLVSTSRFYGGVPFGTLALPEEDGTSRQLLYLHEIRMVPSATVLAWQRSVAKPADKSAASSGILALEPVRTDDLPGAHEEVESLRDRFAGVTVRTETGKPAISDIPRSTGVVHVAAHTEINDERPWHSGILLGESEGDFDEDPYLRAGDIATASLPVEVAVLSGCESAMGRPSVGEGVAGLTSAFLSAGVRSVVATLWRVDDAVTADLMGRFYDGLAGGLPVAAALRQAQLDIGAMPETSHPFYWAGFVVVGDAGGSVDLERKQAGFSVSLLLVLLGVVALASMLWIFNRFNKLKKPSASV
jgi:tetratricopeptide (TPR) repeat protein